LVAKAIAPELLLRRDVDGVELGIETPKALAAAVERLGARLDDAGYRLDGVLPQRQVAGGIEAVVGVTDHPTFGPLVGCGLGDASCRPPRVTDRDAEEMLSKLRAGRLLAGYRGAPPGDRPALVSVIQRVSALVEVVPELHELELNPVKVLEPGRGAIVVAGR